MQSVGDFAKTYLFALCSSYSQSNCTCDICCIPGSC